MLELNYKECVFDIIGSNRVIRNWVDHIVDYANVVFMQKLKRTVNIVNVQNHC